MSCDYGELEKLAKKLKTQGKSDTEKFINDCAKELAARFLSLVIKSTPVGDYDDGKLGGTLRRGWTGGKKTPGAQYAGTLPIKSFGKYYVVEIINPVEYASYVEFGHRTRGGKGWVEGRFFMTDAEMKIQTASRAILEKKLKKYLEGIFTQ